MINMEYVMIVKYFGGKCVIIVDFIFMSKESIVKFY